MESVILLFVMFFMELGRLCQHLCHHDVKGCIYKKKISLPSKLVPGRDWSGEQPPVLLLKEVKRC